MSDFFSFINNASIAMVRIFQDKLYEVVMKQSKGEEFKVNNFCFVSRSRLYRVFFIQFVKNVIDTVIFNKEVKNMDTNVGEVKKP